MFKCGQDRAKYQGSKGSWKTWKVLEFYFDVFEDWKVLEKLQVFKSPGNVLISSSKVFRIYKIRNVC